MSDSVKKQETDVMSANLLRFEEMRLKRLMWYDMSMKVGDTRNLTVGEEYAVQRRQRGLDAMEKQKVNLIC